VNDEAVAASAAPRDFRECYIKLGNKSVAGKPRVGLNSVARSALARDQIVPWLAQFYPGMSVLPRHVGRPDCDRRRRLPPRAQLRPLWVERPDGLPL